MERVNIDMSRSVVLDELGYDVFNVEIRITKDRFPNWFSCKMLQLDVRPWEESRRWVWSEPGRKVG